MARPHVETLRGPVADRVLVWGHFHPAGAGTPTGLVGEGVESVARTGIGEFTVTLEDTYYACECAGVAIGANAVTDAHAQLGAIDVAAKTIKIHTFTGGCAALDSALSNSGAFPHLTAKVGASLISADDASDLATLKALTKEICETVEAHDDDTTMHVAADTGALDVAAWTSKPAAPADLTECQACLNEIKGDWNTHRVKGPYGTIHTGADAYSTIDAANGSSQSTCETLANQLKARINRSLQAGYAPSLPADIAAHADNAVFFWAWMAQGTLPA